MKKNLVSSVYWLLAAVLILSPFQSFGRLPVANAMAPSRETMTTSPGVIAYVAPNQPNGDEIHLINPDGSNNRLLFSTNHPLEAVLSDIGTLAWKPDASELAFSSRHENTCSLYDADIYAIRPDGTNYRRITGEPACGSRAGLPTGTVTVPVYNGTNHVGPFFIYFEGAPGIKSVALSPGSGPTMVTFENVADYGPQDQYAVFITMDGRSLEPAIHLDVVPGETVQTNPMIITAGFPDWGSFWPTYLPDGSRIATIFNELILYEFDPNSQASGWNPNQVPWDFGLWGSALLWAPTPELQDYFLYYGAVEDEVWGVRSSIYLGNAKTGERQEIFDVDPNLEGNALLGLAWLPDGSGFLYSLAQFIWADEYTYIQVANLWEYSFDTGESTQLTSFTNGYTHQMSVSPDGSKIVFEYQSTGNWIDPNPPIDLLMMNRDGTGNVSVLVEGARSPAWSPAPIPDFNPVPVLTSLNPTSANAGGANFTLTVNGSNFMNGSVVRWNGSNRTTTYISSTQLTASIPAADIATAGSANVTVFNPGQGGGTSNVTTFSIVDPTAQTIRLYLPFIKY